MQLQHLMAPLPGQFGEFLIGGIGHHQHTKAGGARDGYRIEQGLTPFRSKETRR